MEKCFYCGKKIEPGAAVTLNRRNEKVSACCSENCKEQATDFLRSGRRYRKFVLLLLLVAVGLMISQVANPQSNNFSVGLLLIGLTLLLFPYPIGLLFKPMGVRWGNWVVRILAVLAFIFAIVLFFI